MLHELSRPIDLEELAFEGEGVPVDLTRRPENSGERAGVTCVKRISPTAAAFAPTAIRGPLWNVDSYDASTGLERAGAKPADQLATVASLDLTINLFVILPQKM